MNISAQQDAVFVGANKQSHVMDHRHGTIAFGAGVTVALWDSLSVDHRGVHQTLNHHTKEVTCVRFLNSGDLVSASEDGSLCLWQLVDDRYKLVLTADQESCSIVALTVVNAGMIVTGNSLGDVTLWLTENLTLSEITSLKVKHNFYPTVMACQEIHGNFILVVGGTSADIHVYTYEPASTSFKEAAALQGHEDWMRCLTFATEQEGLDYVLALGSQDRYIRLWRLRINEAIDTSDEDDSKLVLLSNKQHRFIIGQDQAAFSFEALIMGHDDWVTDLKWHPSAGKLQLLSLSADTSLMIWDMDPESGVWVTVNRLGEMSIKGASTATGASGGFWSCLWFKVRETSSEYILTSGKTGAIRMYKRDASSDTWVAELGVTGPTCEVTDLLWSPEGSHLLVTSADQTTRLLAPWSRDLLTTWHEFARPQIHGYDMICIDHISSTRFVSGGDEKVLRVFDMTQSISDLLKRLTGFSVNDTSLPETAALPVLGLSNKAANDQLESGEAQQREEDHENDDEAEKSNDDPLADLKVPPSEGYLQRHTLFPEIEKLYGHGYELTCCAYSPQNSLIASACRSNSAKHAVIRIFNAAKDFQLVAQSLPGHNLTITSLEFSPDGKHLLAVSRDRQFSLWTLTDADQGSFELKELNEKAHSKIIWDCSWCPSGKSFVTGSRDKALKVWQFDDTETKLVSLIKTSDAITSVACLKDGLVENYIVIAVGHESGKISIYGAHNDELTMLHTFDASITPASRITKLAFGVGKSSSILAVGSTDTSIRLYSVKFPQSITSA